MTEFNILAKSVYESTCPACSHHIAVPFLKKHKQPLATLSWPEDEISAKNIKHLPLNFVRCVNCGHVYNMSFNYNDVPYSKKPNLMFNQGSNWSTFIEEITQKILSRLSDSPVIIEIGHGDGSFLSSLAKCCPKGRFIGFDPHGATLKTTNEDVNLEFRSELFDPVTHFIDIIPDMIISRHVLEHLMNPLAFLQRLSFAAACQKISPLTYFEVPCIDRVIETGRTVDFYYEHSSQFTTESFTHMFRCSTLEINEIGYGYDNEVIYSFSKLDNSDKKVNTAVEASYFHDAAEIALINISEQLEELYTSDINVAVWGGTGKSCAFMFRYGLDIERFPIVVDSDYAKVGTYVPGTGQEIRSRDWLISNPVDVIIIPAQWRAWDIINEMKKICISTNKILIEHRGKLIDFHHDEHPYRLQ